MTLSGMPHIHKDIDFTVSAAIVHDGKVLLVDHPRYGYWLLPGGHVELDEDTDQALLREIAEETGLQLKDIEVLAERPEIGSDNEAKSLWRPQWMNIHKAGEHHRHIGLWYLVRAKSGQVRLDEKEHKAVKWFSAEGISNPSLRTPSHDRHYALEAIRLAA